MTRDAHLQSRPSGDELNEPKVPLRLEARKGSRAGVHRYVLLCVHM